MKIRFHSESHIVELEDGSRWQIYPGDLDLTLNWKPDTELTVMPSDDEISSHTLVGAMSMCASFPAEQVGLLPRLKPRCVGTTEEVRPGRAIVWPRII